MLREPSGRERSFGSAFRPHQDRSADVGAHVLPRETWYAEPAKVADNFYFIGTKIHNAWAITGTEDMIVIEALFDAANDEIFGGLRKLGLDRNKLRYVIFSHAHADQDGGRGCCNRRLLGCDRQGCESPGKPSATWLARTG
jgi:Metallo-beta-lactamase superfamily